MIHSFKNNQKAHQHQWNLQCSWIWYIFSSYFPQTQDILPRLL